MHRCERQCSESVPCGDYLFCTTEVFENIVSQLPNIIFIRFILTFCRPSVNTDITEYSRFRNRSKKTDSAVSGYCLL